jgi:hypothetical protein
VAELPSYVWQRYRCWQLRRLSLGGLGTTCCLPDQSAWPVRLAPREVKGPRNSEVEPEQPSSQVVRAIENIIYADNGALRPMDEDW